MFARLQEMASRQTTRTGAQVLFCGVLRETLCRESTSLRAGGVKHGGVHMVVHICQWSERHEQQAVEASS